jgi:S1-C subfamily serine protease/tRNA A-37 threonylcarbamoyl transferase component Bud32
MDNLESEHPNGEMLTAFGLGRLVGAEASAVEQHLSVCDRCRTVIDAASADTFISLLRDAVLHPAEPPTTPQAKAPAGEAVTLPPGPTTAAIDPEPAALAGHPRYRIVELLGAGGMGAVYKAEHRIMDRTVALKVVSHSLTDNPAMVERFRREVKAAARLTHPNIVTAYDADQAGDTHFLVMEYVEGISLARLVTERGRLPVAEACEYARQVALGLQHANERGMVHRDIKPQNLMRTPGGQIKILDFGLARFAMEAPPAGALLAADPAAPPTGSLTQTGSVVGTPDYIAPEQVRDAHTADIRADLYSLGCTLYDLLAGQAPFPEGTAVQKLAAHMDRTPRPLTELRQDLPPGLVAVVERLLAKDPAQRYQTPAEVAQALEPFATSANRAPTGRRSRGLLAASRRRRWLLTGAALVLVALIAVIPATLSQRAERTFKMVGGTTEDLPAPSAPEPVHSYTIVRSPVPIRTVVNPNEQVLRVLPLVDDPSTVLLEGLARGTSRIVLTDTSNNEVAYLVVVDANRISVQPEPGQRTPVGRAPVMQTTPSPAPSAVLSKTEPGWKIYRRLLQSTVLILVPLNKDVVIGTGTLIDKKNRLVLTNRHLVARATSEPLVFFPTYKDGKLITSRQYLLSHIDDPHDVIRSTVLRQDADVDLALVQLTRVPSSVEALPLASARPNLGDRIYSLGNPRGSDSLWIFGRGDVRAFNHQKGKMSDGSQVFEVDGDVMRTTMPTLPGESGGPVVNGRAELVAVAEVPRTDAGLLANSVDLTEIRKFLERAAQQWDIQYDLPRGPGIDLQADKRK